MGHGCPLRPKQVNGSPRPPPLQRTLSVVRGSLDKGILVPKISRMRVQISRMRSRSAGYAANAALPYNLRHNTSYHSGSKPLGYKFIDLGAKPSLEHISLRQNFPPTATSSTATARSECAAFARPKARSLAA